MLRKGEGLMCKPQSKIRVANDCQNPIFKMFLKIPSKIFVDIIIIQEASKWRFSYKIFYIRPYLGLPSDSPP